MHIRRCTSRIIMAILVQVAEAAVIAVPHAKWTERPLLIVVAAQKAAPPSKKEILEFLANQLCEHNGVLRSYPQCTPPPSLVVFHCPPSMPAAHLTPRALAQVDSRRRTVHRRDTAHCHGQDQQAAPAGDVQGLHAAAEHAVRNSQGLKRPRLYFESVATFKVLYHLGLLCQILASST